MNICCKNVLNTSNLSLKINLSLNSADWKFNRSCMVTSCSLPMHIESAHCYFAINQTRSSSTEGHPVL